MTLKEKDPEIYASIEKEKQRQKEGLEMIASENYVSDSVLEAQGSVLTNKYAEGPRVIPASGITEDANSSIRSNNWPSTGRKSFSAAATPTFNRTPDLRPTWPCTWRNSSPATRSWEWIFLTAAT
jgi:hypothetical protein